MPGMNSVCKALCREPGMEFKFIVSAFWVLLSQVSSVLGVETRFGQGIGRLDWLVDRNAWSLTSMDGNDAGQYMGVVATDKNTFLSRFTDVTGKQPPIGMSEYFGQTYTVLNTEFNLFTYLVKLFNQWFDSHYIYLAFLSFVY